MGRFKGYRYCDVCKVPIKLYKHKKGFRDWWGLESDDGVLVGIIRGSKWLCNDCISYVINPKL